MGGEATIEGLHRLARLHGVEVEFRDSAGQTRRAAPETILGVLRALGAPVDGLEDVLSAMVERRRALRARWIEPVAVAWEGATPAVPLRLTGAASTARLECRLAFEGGDEHAWTVAVADLGPAVGPDDDEAEGEGGPVVRRSLPVPVPVPIGYHRLAVRLLGEERTCLIVAAPRKVEGGPSGKSWGVFCPAYALHRGSGWGAGDFSDLEALVGWTADRGGGLVATLPMLATFLDGEVVSPYSPASRLFWNESYLDPSRLPELASCAPARDLIESAEFRREVEAARLAPLIDYRRQAGLKRRVFEILAVAAFESGAERSSSFRRFLDRRPEAGRYARFMAAGERHGRDWSRWPADARDPSGRGEPDDRAGRYHLYVQWRADEALRSLAGSARARGLTWYVDFPVGVDPRGYDAWSRPGLFADRASTGCPPDRDFTEAQDWRFPPPHPDRQRESGYPYLIAALRNHLEHAGALRLDHVMALHRLYWIPEGTGRREGAYVRYPSEELYAILAVESRRSGAWIVGEDLGTVPPEVPRAMNEHGLRGLYVLQHELKTHRESDPPLPEPPPATIASLNTHDIPPFSAYWAGLDIDDRESLGILRGDRAAEEKASRPEERRALVAYLRRLGLLGDGDGEGDDPEDAAPVVRAALEFLAGSPAQVALVNLEDLWGGTEPQNVPVTSTERPNWRRRLRYPLNEIGQLPGVAETLRRVDELRRQGPA